MVGRPGVMIMALCCIKNMCVPMFHLSVCIQDFMDGIEDAIGADLLVFFLLKMCTIVEKLN